jgi:hypothetical protein
MQPQKTARENEPPRGNGNVAVLPDDELDAVTGGLGKILGGKGKIIDGQSSISASLVLAPKSGPRGRRDRPPASSMRRCLRQVFAADDRPPEGDQLAHVYLADMAE